jgi:sterol desaturase/sphingolipid hydroxylase (fatty acid hydroxylase superfamily)
MEIDMDLAPLDQFVRLHGEALQYAAFFGTLVLFGALELLITRRREGTQRQRRWPVNGGLTIINIFVLALLPVSTVAMADMAAARGWGLLHWLDVAPAAALVAGIVIRSLVSWAIHLAMHKLPLLWRIHRVHHCDRQMDISTTVRLHPLELVISLPITLAVVVALGLPPLALILYEIADAGLAVFTHANMRLPAKLDRLLQLVIVTPDMHRVHHSTWQPETDSNYGATLSIWDRLFGTYRVKAQHELTAMALGLEDIPERQATSLPALLTLPFRVTRFLGASADAASPRQH